MPDDRENLQDAALEERLRRMARRETQPMDDAMTRRLLGVMDEEIRTAAPGRPYARAAAVAALLALAAGALVLLYPQEQELPLARVEHAVEIALPPAPEVAVAMESAVDECEDACANAEPCPPVNTLAMGEFRRSAPVPVEPPAAAPAKVPRRAFSPVEIAAKQGAAAPAAKRAPEPQGPAMAKRSKAPRRARAESPAGVAKAIRSAQKPATPAAQEYAARLRHRWFWFLGL